MSARKFTAAERAQFVVLLKAAKLRLWEGVVGQGRRALCICNAIPNRGGASQLRAEITRRLDGHLIFSFWLDHQRGVNKKDLTCANIQAHRHAWVDLLIAEFSA